MFVGIFALYIQLAAMAACLSGPPVDLAAAGPFPGAFPICHAQTGAEDPISHGGHAPAHQQGCAFCSVHCHGAMAVPPTLASATPFLILSASAENRPFVLEPLARFPAGAPPRGPPLIG